MRSDEHEATSEEVNSHVIRTVEKLHVAVFELQHEWHVVLLH